MKRDFLISLVMAIAAVVLKVTKGRLSWSFTRQNAIEAIFPVVVLLGVFGSIEIVKGARKLMKEMADETVEVEIDSGLLNAQGGMIVKPVRIVMPWYRFKIVSMSVSMVVFLALICVVSWRWYIPVSDPSSDGREASPSPSQTPIFATQPVASPHTTPPQSRKRRSTPCSAEDRLLGRC